MGRPVVHFEIIGTDPGALRRYYGELFGWRFDVGDAAAEEVSAPGEYGFVRPGTTTDGEVGSDGGGDGGAPAGIPGGVGGGAGYEQRTLFYVGVPEVEAALQQAERLGGSRVSGPHRNRDGSLVVGFFADPEGHLVGLAASG